MIRSLFITLTVILFGAFAAAQQHSSRPSAPPRLPASDFNIELINFEGPSRLESVPGGGLHAGYLVTAELRRLAEWKPSAEAPEAAAVKVGYWMEDGAVKVEVIGYLGKKSPFALPSDLSKMQKVILATLLLHENETATVKETETIGIEPIGLRVVRSNLWSVGQPEITNKTQALNVTAVAEQRPAYTLTVRNVSPKCISSMRWYGLENGRRGGGSGLSGACLIPAGGVFDFRQSFALDYRGEGENPQPPGKREIVIEAVLFDDGTFDGDIGVAAGMAASVTGTRMQRARVLQLLRSVAGAPVEDPLQSLAQLKQEISSLSEEIDEATTKELSQRFATASPEVRERSIREQARNGLRFVKTDVLSLIKRFEYQREHSPNEANFGVWLKEVTTTLEK